MVFILKIKIKEGFQKLYRFRKYSIKKIMKNDKNV